MASMSKPRWLQKRASSAAIAASTSDGEMSEIGRQRLDRPWPSATRCTISRVIGGGTKR